VTGIRSSHKGMTGHTLGAAGPSRPSSPWATRAGLLRPAPASRPGPVLGVLPDPARTRSVAWRLCPNPGLRWQFVLGLGLGAQP
jgi:hypothetical protein